MPDSTPTGPFSLADELWREYEFTDTAINKRFIYRINGPRALYVGATTHRVVDIMGIVHCVPKPGTLGCVLRWQPATAARPVQF